MITTILKYYFRTEIAKYIFFKLAQSQFHAMFDMGSLTLHFTYWKKNSRMRALDADEVVA